MANEKEISSPTNEQQHFVEHLEQASQIVRAWPAWKRTVLGQVESPQDAREEQISSSSPQPSSCSAVEYH